MDAATARSGTRINAALCGLAAMPMALLLGMSEGPAVGRAIALASLGMLVLAREIYRAGDATATSARLQEAGLAAVGTGVVSGLANCQWDLVAALYAAFALLFAITALVDGRCARNAGR